MDAMPRGEYWGGEYLVSAMGYDGSYAEVLVGFGIPTPMKTPNPDALVNVSGQIVFVSDRDGDKEIYLMDADGENLLQLTNNDASGDISPVWSPDGELIAFDSERDGDREIFVMDAEGGNQRNLTNNGTMERSPALFNVFSWNSVGSNGETED